MFSNESCRWGSCMVSQLAETYGIIHFYWIGVICTFGIIANVINILVLTRKHMYTPTNVLLTGLSAAQLLLITNYSLLQLVERFRECHEFVWTKGASWYKYLNVNFNLVFHTIALTHTVCLALFRFASIRYPMLAQKYLKGAKTRRWSLVIYAVVPVFCIPIFMVAHVKDMGELMLNCSGSVSKIEHSYDLDWTNNYDLITVTLWMFGVLFKLIPCSLIAVFSALLLLSLRDVNKKKARLLSSSNTNNPQQTVSKKKKPQAVRTSTTRMLITVVLLCFAVEFPQGILNLLVGIYGPEFGNAVYVPLGDFFEMLTLLYSSINFVLYSLMSTDFKTTCLAMFSCRKFTRPDYARSFLAPNTESKGGIKRVSSALTIAHYDSPTHERNGSVSGKNIRRPILDESSPHLTVPILRPGSQDALSLVKQKSDTYNSLSSGCENALAEIYV